MENSSKGSKVVKWVLIGVSFLFIAIMLILPLITVLTEAFKDGIKVFYQAVTDKYTVDAIVLTLEATGIAVIVNKENPVSDLTKDEVMNIYTGELTSWDSVNK